MGFQRPGMSRTVPMSVRTSLRGRRATTRAALGSARIASRTIAPLKRLVPFLTAVALGSSGCGSSNDTAPVVLEERFKGVALSVAVLDDLRFTEAITDRIGEWEESRGGTVSVQFQGDETSSSLENADVIVFRGDRLGDLIDQESIQRLPRSLVEPPEIPDAADADEAPKAIPDDPVAFEEFAPAYRDEVPEYGDELYALPVGGTALVLVYRIEAFENEDLINAAEEAGLELEEPETWEALDALARFLHGRDLDGDGDTEAGLALALGPDEQDVAASILLARAAASGFHPDFYSFLLNSDTMEPRIDSPPFVQALEALIKLKDVGPESDAPLDIEAARAAFRSGEAALLIDRAERADAWIEEDSDLAVGVARLPGASLVFNPDRDRWESEDRPNRPTYLPHGGGWLAAVGAGSEHVEAARDFALYLIEEETAARLRADPRARIVPLRSRLIALGPPETGSFAALERRTWSDAVSRTLLADRVVSGLRIPGARGYFADLEAARTRAAAGDASAAEALAAAAEAWRERTDTLGLERQRWHYRRSLNELAAGPEPPRP